MVSEAAPASSERVARVDAARRRWIERLIDLGRNNRMLYFRATKRTLSLDAPDMAMLARLLAGSPVAPEALLPDRDVAALRKTVRDIERQTRVILEEKGLRTLFLGIGTATWDPGDGGTPPNAPVLLIPAAIEVAQRGDSPWRLRLDPEDEPQLNPVLAHAMDRTFQVRLDPEELTSLLDEPVNPEQPLEPGEELPPDGALPPEVTRFDPVFDAIREAATRVPQFRIDRRFILAGFHFQKMAMVKDLEEHAEAMAANDLIAALAGDTEARVAVTAGRTLPDPGSFDEQPPTTRLLVLDADSSQEAVIAAVLDGHHGVIQGPPGTGKSQTITNLIATLAAEGKRVLFVAEKRAALEVVKRRLDNLGLGHLALDLHDAEVSRRAVMAQMKAADELARRAGNGGDLTGISAQLLQVRTRLNSHDDAVNEPLPGAPASIYALQGIALATPAESRAAARWRETELAVMQQDAIERGEALLAEAAGYGGLLARRGESPWVCAAVDGPDDIARARDLAARVSALVEPARAAAERLRQACGVDDVATLSNTQSLVERAAAVAKVIERYDPSLLDLDLAALEQALAPARGFASRLVAQVFNSAYRRAKDDANRLRDAKADGTTLLAEVTALRTALAEWTVAYPDVSAPRDSQAARDAQEAMAPLMATLAELDALAPPQCDDGSGSFDGLAARLEAMHADQVTLQRLPHVRGIRQQIAELGFAALLAEIEQAEVPGERWPGMLRYAWARSWLDVLLARSGLGAFVRANHEHAVEQFRTLDAALIEATATHVRSQHARRYIESLNQFPEQAGILQKELHKKSRHIPLRRLIERAPDVTLALTPCWMASPLSVSALTPADRELFDVIVFDEASQVFPEDAIPVFMRGKQVAVAGDPYQLPPTNFFRLDSEDETPDPDDGTSAVEGFESILDNLLALFGPWMLTWHYRSRDEKLIAYSNREIYGGRLVTFPGPQPHDCIRHELVAPDPRDLADETSVSAEVRRVVELVLEHTTQRPHETLGVIALGIEHANRLEAALEQALDLRRDLDGFFAQGGPEPFFIKNLERVQGDERDAIILSIGYGKDRAGKLRHNFGPINRQGGERRLNVAITRSRQRMTVVSSFSYRDIDLTRTNAHGVAVLRGYLEYAESGGRAFDDARLTQVPMNPFEADIYDALTARGYRLVPQLGVSNYRLDFAVQHPERPGEFVLAIEADGATYHSADTARDRDRLRQAHLERLGWRVYRIWSTDWFMTRDLAIDACCRAIDEAIAESDVPEAFATQEAVDSRPQPAADAVPGGRGPRPRIQQGIPIDEHSFRELTELVAWIQSDGLLRTDEEIAHIARIELGYNRMGSRIRQRLEQAIRGARRTGIIS